MFNKSLPWENKQNILLTSHAFADPDALGSMMALSYFLEKAGKETVLAIYGGVPSNQKFLVHNRPVLGNFDKLNLRDFDLIVVLDCADLELCRLPQVHFASKEKRLPLIANIDHHPDNKMFGTYNYVDNSYAATAEIIYELLLFAGQKIDELSATVLLAGIIGDTASFKHSNTKSKTLKIAGELLALGARLDIVSKNLFTQKTPEQLKAWSHVFEHAWFDKENRAIISGVTEEDITTLGVEDDAFAGAVEILNTYPEAKFAALFRQRDDEVKVSLRSENYKGMDVSDLARRFGGGGHKLAAGFSVRGKLVRKGKEWHILPING